MSHKSVTPNIYITYSVSKEKKNVYSHSHSVLYVYSKKKKKVKTHCLVSYPIYINISSQKGYKSYESSHFISFFL